MSIQSGVWSLTGPPCVKCILPFKIAAGPVLSTDYGPRTTDDGQRTVNCRLSTVDCLWGGCKLNAGQAINEVLQVVQANVRIDIPLLKVRQE